MVDVLAGRAVVCICAMPIGRQCARGLSPPSRASRCVLSASPCAVYRQAGGDQVGAGAKEVSPVGQIGPASIDDTRPPHTGEVRFAVEQSWRGRRPIDFTVRGSRHVWCVAQRPLCSRRDGSQKGGQRNPGDAGSPRQRCAS